jgi:hypothetical protein
MSRGPGKIERAIEAVFAAEPDDAFTTADLCDWVYPALNRVEKKHRVAVIRAAMNVCGRTGWGCYRTESLGGTLVFYNPFDVMSYAIGRTKADFFTNYRNNDRRMVYYRGTTTEGIRGTFEPGGKKHDMIVEGGHWWRHVQLNIAARDGDTSERAQALQAEQDRAAGRAQSVYAATAKIAAVSAA